MCVEVVLINVLASHLAPQTKIPGFAPVCKQTNWKFICINYVSIMLGLQFMKACFSLGI